MKKFQKRLKNPFLWVGMILGAAGGYAYYHFVGCERGCPITSNPFKSMAWGLLMGMLLGDIFYKPEKTENNKNTEP